ncbi:DUF3025 domain-containing protein [Massilia sp. TS11]|uniref:DUF3025 domain-containing protein n=1 Tax=Massilia sp. TS11 TaxID=2908003 RepID=UPI001EDB9928|nr:DUF3025 domain-containing protein [Massilia sp. TS11]MCG2586892.1 DUF3025 domain-containing protein [Massilia sp. TS11]
MLGQIDWSRPWLDAVRPAWASLDPAAGLLPMLNGGARARGLRNWREQPLCFVPQAELPAGVAYEAYIGAEGRVPTRENLHDFFNALVWLSFPAIKRQLNAMQAAQIAASGVGPARGPARDALTIFDENAAILVARDASIGAALRAHDWHGALVAPRARWWREVQLWSFGHALMEKLVAPRKAITAHVYLLQAPASYFEADDAGQRAWIDATVSARLHSAGISTADFTPLPVLGVPGWWPGQDAAFYADTQVFRPKRQTEAAC